MEPDRLPAYDELPLSTYGAPWRSAWGVFGDSLLGTLNLLTPARRLAALGLVKEGLSINLDHPLDLPLHLFGHRRPYVHNIFEIMPGYYDETLDDFAPQLSSQWDGLGHARSPDGFYGGVSQLDATRRSGPLGIDGACHEGVVGRGLLLDVAGYQAAQGDPIDPNVRREIPASVLDDVAAHQGSDIRTGDVLLVRFGVDTFLRRLYADPSALDMTYASPGLAQEDATVEWLWNAHVAAVCADNIAVEVTPPRGPLTRLHPALIGLLGLRLGELFDFSELAAVCHRRGSYEFLFVAKPIYLPGGMGSPANALAIL